MLFLLRTPVVMGSVSCSCSLSPWDLPPWSSFGSPASHPSSSCCNAFMVTRDDSVISVSKQGVLLAKFPVWCVNSLGKSLNHETHSLSTLSLQSWSWGIFPQSFAVTMNLQQFNVHSLLNESKEPTCNSFRQKADSPNLSNIVKNHFKFEQFVK